MHLRILLAVACLTMSTRELQASEASSRLINVPFSAVQALTTPEPDRVVRYGEDPLQFGELWMPRGEGKVPVLILIHGGCWRNSFGLDHVRALCAALRSEGFAVWSIEYRRIGDVGGGWPGTFLDVARAADHLRSLAAEDLEAGASSYGGDRATDPMGKLPAAHRLDLERVISIGHSAGGHLALWLANRAGLEGTDLEEAGKRPLPLQGVVGLAAIADLPAYSRGESGCERSTLALLGGTPEEQPERYALASPSLRPHSIPVRLIHGEADAIVPFSQTKALGDSAHVSALSGAGHFDVIHPGSVAWPVVVEAVKALSK